eukprot:729178_1
MLCNGDYNRPLKIVCYDWDRNDDPDLIGEVLTSLTQLTANPTCDLALKRSTKKGVYGHIELTKHVVEKGYSMLEFMKGGLEIQFMVGIDFTASNGDPNNRSSLHYMRNTRNPNEYQRALRSVGSVLEPYDSDSMIPAWGFGARINGEVEHCFPVNFNPDDAEVCEVSGLMEAYAACLPRIKLSGPTLISQILNTAASIASEPWTADSQHYSILLILTDGIINDVKQSVDAIVAATNLPLSIIIVGVGDADFSTMEFLDADDEPLVSSAGEKMKRGIVQFVPFRQFAAAPWLLAKETLAEVPEQFSAFVRHTKTA